MAPISSRKVTLSPTIEPNPDEVVVRPHKRHKPKRKMRDETPEEKAARDKVEAAFDAAYTQPPPETITESPANFTESPANSSVTLWNCEGCGQVVDHYPCKCGYPEKVLQEPDCKGKTL